MKMFCVITLALGVALCGCGRKPAQQTPPATNASSGNPLTAPADYVGAAVNAQKQARRITEGASLSQALQQFYAGEERHPKDLNELVTKGYLRQVPPPPAGMKYDYNPATGQLKLVKQ
jgi:hypothetical protein